MAIRQILEVPDPRLKTVSEPVTEFNDELDELDEDVLTLIDGGDVEQRLSGVRPLAMQLGEERGGGGGGGGAIGAAPPRMSRPGCRSCGDPSRCEYSYYPR